MKPNNRAAQYAVLKTTTDPRSGGTVWIKDTGDHKKCFTITNDAENVVKRVCLEYGTDKRVFYKDSEGEWAELVHSGGVFQRYAPLQKDLTPPQE